VDGGRRLTPSPRESLKKRNGRTIRSASSVVVYPLVHSPCSPSGAALIITVTRPRASRLWRLAANGICRPDRQIVHGGGGGDFCAEKPRQRGRERLITTDDLDRQPRASTTSKTKGPCVLARPTVLFSISLTVLWPLAAVKTICKAWSGPGPDRSSSDTSSHDGAQYPSQPIW